MALAGVPFAMAPAGVPVATVWPARAGLASQGSALTFCTVTCRTRSPTSFALLWGVSGELSQGRLRSRGSAPLPLAIDPGNLRRQKWVYGYG